MKLLFSILFCASFCLNAQITLGTYQPDFGLITKKGDRFVDVSIKNNTNKKEFIFRIDAPKEYTINFSSKTLEPDSVRTIRIKYNPKEKGLFSHELKLHLSHLEIPLTITTKGFVEDFNENSNPLCPSFNDKNISKETSFELEILVVEQYSQQPIKNAYVSLIQNGNIKYKLVTNGKGRVEKEVPLGLYYSVATAQGYSTDEYMAYVNRNNNFLKFELEKKAPIDIPTDTTDFEEEIVIVTTPPELPPVDIPDSLIIVDVPEIIDTSDFSVNKFAANNIVFCVDISASMKYTGRLDLLKASMISLTNLLRPIDNITIVAYASEASVIMETTSAANKEEIIRVIEQLEASGNTAGIEGMKLAYVKACNGYIDGGNNEVIMATDGGFNKGEGSTKKLAKKYTKRKIEMSIVGIKVPNNNHVESMRSVAGSGNGVFIPIKTYEQAQNSLVNEIKRQSMLNK